MKVHIVYDVKNISFCYYNISINPFVGDVMKLIYFYLWRCYDVEFNLGINLSEDTFITLKKDNTLEIKELEHQTPLDFYGENIINVSAIVGKNGSGKSTILNILGLKRLDVQSCYPDSQWMAIYEHNGAYFLEGFNLEEKFNIYKYANKYIAYSLKKNNNELLFDDYIQNHDEIQNNYCVIHTPNFSNSTNRDSSSNIHEQDDRNYGFKRHYLKSNDSSLYEFITKNSDFCSHLSNKEISININTNRDNIKFYSKFSYYLEPDLISLIIKNRKEERIKDKKKVFLISLLESYILFIINNVFEERNKTPCKKIIIKNKYNGDILDYNQIMKSLTETTNEIIDFLRKNDDEILEYLGYENFFEILNLIEHNDKLIFKKNLSFSISLDEYDKSTHELILEIEKKPIPITKIPPQMSSGEYNLNNKVAGISKAISLSKKNLNNIDGFIIILDEYDENLHPEWSRCFLSYLLDYLKKEHAENKFQLIISTHSPYIISDLMKENIIKIEYDSSLETYSSIKATHSFASNIYDIINDSFFLSQPIGQFAINKIDKILSSINEGNINSDEYTNLKKTINVIDDPYIRKTLLDKLHKCHTYNKDLELEIIEKEIENLTSRRNKILNDINGGGHD
ncbi:AAA family ATPase [Providencia sp. PROV193]|uniref:AAA family ATPase n=1 Tax=Providencia sp. PROV193 TaxID=2949894 RepID=UPI00234B6CA1|nr:AAA family ATPase [Providencia sp. PROV193]